MLEERMVGRLCLADQQEEHLRRWLDCFTLMQEDSWPCVFLGGHVKNQISHNGQGWRRQYVLWSSKSWRSQLGPGKSDQGPQQNGGKTQKCKKYLCWRLNSTICQDPTKMQNRFAGLDSSEQSSAPQGYDGRGSGGRFGRGGAYTGTAVKQIQRCTSVKHLRLVHTYTLEHTGRNSRGGSSEQERSADRRGNGRAEAAQSVCRDQSFHQCCCWGFFYLASDSRCETSWVPSQLGLSQLWDPTHLFRSWSAPLSNNLSSSVLNALRWITSCLCREKTRHQEVQAWWPRKRFENYDSFTDCSLMEWWTVICDPSKSLSTEKPC